MGVGRPACDSHLRPGRAETDQLVGERRPALTRTEMTLSSPRSRGSDWPRELGPGKPSGRDRPAALGAVLPPEAQGGGPGRGWAGSRLNLGRRRASRDVSWQPLSSPCICGLRLPAAFDGPHPPPHLTCSCFGQTRPHRQHACLWPGHPYRAGLPCSDVALRLL